MKRNFLIFLMVACVVVCLMGATPEKPYPDLADGDTLSATWLLGTFNVLYNWCQTASTTITAHTVATTGHGATGAVVGTTNTQTLTSKTLTSPTINDGIVDLDGGTFSLPESAAPAQTAEGSVVWDTDDLLTVGTGAGRKTMVDTDSTQTISGKTLTSPTVNDGSFDLDGGTLSLPEAAAPAQTAEGSIVWDTDDLLTVGTGAGRKTMVDTDSTQTLTGKSISGEQIDSGTVADARVASTLARDTEVTTAVNNHNVAVGVHGLSAGVAVVGASETQTLTNKSISGEQINSGTVAEARVHADLARDSEVTSAISTHDDNSAHGCTSVASATALASHEADNSSVHGCTNVASASALASHEADNSSVHGCTSVASATALAEHAGATEGVHGLTAGTEVVGATDTQTIENKTFTTGCVWNGGVISAEYLDLGGTGAYDVAGFIPGTIPDGSANCFLFVAPRGLVLPSSLTDSRARSLTAATAESVFSVWLNTVSVATLTFAAGSATGTYSMTATQTMVAGDMWKVTGPASGDTTLADIAFTFKGTY